jgi:3-phenylpropionate/trans-cinnamate dioxygenase alpha subunit
MPGVYKWSFGANWKTIADNLAGDNAHVPYTHASILKLGPAEVSFDPVGPGTHSFLTRTDKGHGFIIAASDDAGLMSPELLNYREHSMKMAAERLTPVQAQSMDAFQIGTIFPNFSYLYAFGFTVIRVSHPRGPDKTETWTWTLGDAEMPEDVRTQARLAAMQQMSPTGIVETDDSEMWIRCQEATSAPYRSRFPNNYQMGLGKGRLDPERPGQIHRPPTEIGSFGIYERWAELMGKGEVS